MNKLALFLFLSMLFQCTSTDKKETYHKPEQNRFEIELVTDNLDQPMAMDVLDDGRIVLVEKDGAVRVVDPITHEIKTLAEIPVNTRFSQPFTTSGQKYDADDGMHGIVVDPDFDENNFIYLYYSPQSEDPKSQVVRYTWAGNSLDLNSKKVLLEWETQRERCCHWGGGMVFDQDKNLLVAIGDNSGFNFNSENGDSRRSSGNTNDLRGSILRINPQADGTYTIPQGNLFPEGTPKTRPEIYIMGVRNPWRLSLDRKTGWIYWGEVGPSTDEFNFAREAGNFGWPFYIANNERYFSGETDHDTARILNESDYNTGLLELPSPPVPAMAWYDRNPSEAFPIPGSGSLSAVGGPIYRNADFTDSKRPFPRYYEGKWFVTDYVRGWIMVIELDDSGNYKSMEEFMPEATFTGINDMKFGAEGDLYVLQYGHDSYEAKAKNNKLFRIRYNDGNRKPIAKATAEISSGSVPLEVPLSAQGTMDYDNNITQYEWSLESDTDESVLYKGANPIVRIEKEGVYHAILTVTDSEGAKDNDTLEIIAGNNAPNIDIDFIGSNKSFYFPGEEMEYAVRISDDEDATIDPSRMNIWFDFLPDGHHLDAFTALLRDSPTHLPARSIVGEQLIMKNNCYQCHSLDQTTVGPSYADVANRYRNEENVYANLSDKIIGGSIGEWGQAEMPAHPAITEDEARSIVDFILNATKVDRIKEDLPLSGSIPVPKDIHPGDLVFKASYRDQGNKSIPSIETVEIEVLRNPRIFIAGVDTSMGMRVYIPHFKLKNHLITNSPEAFLGVNNIDFTGIKEIGLEIIDFDKVKDSHWIVSIRSGSENGELLGSAKIGDLEKVDDKIHKLKIKEVSGKRDLYVVFTNKEGDHRLNEIEIRSVSF